MFFRLILQAFSQIKFSFFFKLEASLMIRHRYVIERTLRARVLTESFMMTSCGYMNAGGRRICFYPVVGTFFFYPSIAINQSN